MRGNYRTRKDKEFCSKACKQWWSYNYGNSKIARAKREREQARRRRESEHREG
ncbi:MAG: hypothetical protein AVDCRST_MAG28-1053 [uncultured Rubrobacteraceae bacterium]|uniref:Uncharacterized protein n=1 Tax=uncultured Rubrobacteraceae bacterium TaxID=349277 RepID=A0A6J4QP97_9ACTN|nr:MAG: hypothetical protein AVDCRST_MAG28-1053 [uncultured Rubrobacteraceae bacterium]